MRASELRNLTNEELNQKLKDLRTELFNMRFQTITGQLANPQRIR
ncbi:MAG: 50S ribosomal protein L29, partial [Candidatus Atribacteria bacterium]|nr:50S ribosomal protein L29 [Candidatus Atribacteria bacterium]